MCVKLRYFTIYEPTGSSNFSYQIESTKYTQKPCPNHCGAFGDQICNQGNLRFNFSL